MNSTDLKPRGRKFASSFQYKNRFYLIGGCHSKYESLSDAYYLDLNNFLQSKRLDDIRWSELKLTNTEAINRWGHVSVVKKAKAYIFGGRQGSKDLQNLISIDLVA
jgi:N-acetylneuraminic acid mutarotase